MFSYIVDTVIHLIASLQTMKPKRKCSTVRIAVIHQVMKSLQLI